jgi:hypothetical protein
MATTPNVPVRKSLKNKLIIAEQIAIYTAIAVALGFYPGVQYNAQQTAKTKAAMRAQ